MSSATYLDNSLTNLEAVLLTSLLLCGCPTRITRNLPATSRIHIVDSYFYTKLSEDGVEAVGKWTKRIDSFSMDIILIPVNQDKHWTLCAAINPSAIINSRRSVKYQSDDDARPLFIFMDSMDAHDPGQICANLRSWLNYHWNKKVGKEKLGLRSTNPFQANEMPVVSPYGRVSGCCCVDVYFKSTYLHCPCPSVISSEAAKL